MNADDKAIIELRQRCASEGWYCTSGNSWSKSPPLTESEILEYEIKNKKRMRSNKITNWIGGILWGVLLIWTAKEAIRRVLHPEL